MFWSENRPRLTASVGHPRHSISRGVATGDDRSALAAGQPPVDHRQTFLPDLDAVRDVGNCCLCIATRTNRQVLGRIGLQLGNHRRIGGLGRQAGEAWPHPSAPAEPIGVAALAEGGVDLRRFLLGLLFVYRVEPARYAELDTGSLGRAMNDSGDAVWFEAELRRLATEPRLDATNRLRAASTLVGMHLRQGRFLRQVRADLASMDLHPAALLWVRQELPSD